MSLVKCSECGRTISDKSKSCVGCGAPLKVAGTPEQQKIFNLVPEPDRRPPPGRQTLIWRAILSTAAFVAGVVWSSTSGNSNRPAALIAGLLIIVGLCGVIVTAVQFPWTRK